MATTPPTSLDALIENAADAMETELSNVPDTPAPAEAAPAPPPAPVVSAPEPPSPSVQAQTPPTPTVAQAEQATPTQPSDYEALKAEIAALKASLATPTVTATETPAEPPPTPQELVELDTIINGFSQSYWKADGDIKQAETNRGPWAQHLAALQDKLEDSLDDPQVDTAALRRDIRTAKDALRRYDHFLESKAQERSSYFRDFKTYETLRSSTEKVLRLTASQERATQAENDRQIESQATNWRTAKWEPAKKAASEKVPEPLRARFDAYVERLGKAHVHSRGEDGRFSNAISDPVAFVNGLADDFLAVAREGAQSYTVQKTAEIPASPANGKAGATVTPTNAKPRNEAEFEAEMDRRWQEATL